MKPLICPQCGGTINRATYQCEYCGTYFEKPAYEGEELKVLKVDAKIKTYVAGAYINNELYVHDEQIADKAAMDMLKHKLADAVMQHVVITRHPNHTLDAQEYKAKIRLVDADYKF